MKKRLRIRIAKRGELTTQQIVILIILIASFAIILFLLFRLDIGKETNAELCRNSVVLRGKSFFPGETIQLKCYKTYKCITFDGSCEKLNNPEVVKVKNTEEIYKELAGEMANCWHMFGEGKVNYLTGGDLKKNNYCSICSDILFDDSLKEIPGLEDGKIDKNNLYYEYLSKNDVPYAKTNFLNYLFGANDAKQFRESVKNQFGTENFGEMEIGKRSLIVTGITSSVSHATWIGGAAGVGGFIGLVIGATTPVGWIAGAIILGVGGAIGGEIGAQIYDLQNPEIGAIISKGKGIDNQFMSPTITETTDSEKYKALNCEDILTLS